MEIFDNLKARGVEDVFFLCIDGVSGLEQTAEPADSKKSSSVIKGQMDGLSCFGQYVPDGASGFGKG